MVTMLLVQIIYMCIGFPEWLSRITQFKYINRMETSYGWLAAIFTIWSIYAIGSTKEKCSKMAEDSISVILWRSVLLFINDSLIGFISNKWILAEIMGFVIILMLAMNYKKNISAILLMCVMLFSGATVNPVRSGISPVTNHPISKFVQTASEMIRMHPG